MRRIADNDLNRLIATYEERNPKRWHHPMDLPGDTLEALKELRELRERITEVAELLGVGVANQPLNKSG